MFAWACSSVASKVKTTEIHEWTFVFVCENINSAISKVGMSAPSLDSGIRLRIS